MLRLPAGACRGRAGGLQRGEKSVADKGVVWPLLRICIRIGAGVPSGSRDVGKAWKDADAQIGVHHETLVLRMILSENPFPSRIKSGTGFFPDHALGLKPSKIIWSA